MFHAEVKEGALVFLRQLQNRTTECRASVRKIAQTSSMESLFVRKGRSTKCPEAWDGLMADIP